MIEPIMKRLPLLVLLSGALAAQSVTVVNHGTTTFSGWKRTTIDVFPEHNAGTVSGVDYVVGRKVGRDVRVVDLRVTLSPGQEKVIDLSDASPSGFRLAPPRGVDWTGGPMLLNGDPMEWISLRADGAAWLVHMRARTGATMCADVWLRHYPGEPYVHGEAMITSSNPNVPGVFEVAEDMRLTIGDGVVIGMGRQFWQPLVDATRFADGQARVVPFTVLFLRHLDVESWSSAQVVMAMGLGAVGISNLLMDGNPTYPEGYDGRSWARSHFPSASERLHDWGPTFAIAADSGQSGAQEEQLFARGEPMLPGSAGAEWVVYMSACKWANRPSHYLEADGSQIDPAAHPNLVLWGGRPHSSGSDQLGKNRAIAGWDTSGGWMGPDRQHWLANTLTAGARYTGSPALQYLLRNQALLFLMGETVDPAKATSSPGAARAVGYAGIIAVHLWDNLEDRDMALHVRQRWRDRVEKVYIPAFTDKPGDIWDPRSDPRITGGLTGYQYGQQNYQQSLGAYGLDLGCSRLGPVEGSHLALRAAKAVLAHAWRKQTDGRWIHWDHTGWRNGEIVPASELVEGLGGHRTGWYERTWAIPGIAVILLHEPYHAVALEIWEQVTEGGGGWIPPGVM